MKKYFAAILATLLMLAAAPSYAQQTGYAHRFYPVGNRYGVGWDLTEDAVANSLTAASIANNTITATQIANNTIGSTQLAPGILQFTSITLTPTNIKGMYAAPVAVSTMPAVTGKSYVIYNVLYRYTYGTAVYVSGGVTALQYGSTADGAGIRPCVGATAALLTTGSSADQIGGGIGTINTGTLGTAMYVSNDTAAFTSSTGTGTLTLDIWYALL